MRLLHTSDWHLGQNFMGKSRQAEHQQLIDWLMAQVDAHAVDAVLIAGDIFDTGTPPSYARELYSQLVVRLHAAGVALLLLGGNHDSVATLRESSALLEQLSARVVPAADAPASQVRVLAQRSSQRRPQREGDSADSTPGCVVCAVPFIRARDVMQSEYGQSAEQKQQSLQLAIQAYYQAVHAEAENTRKQLSAQLGRNVPLIATGHLTTVGASASESVREIYVGALDAFPTSAFPSVDYLALGHIHRPQKVGGLEHIRYSGSPIALSFDEAAQQKEVLLVDLGETGLEAVTPVPVPVFQPLVALRGNLKSLPGAFAQAASDATPKRPVWLEVTVAEDDYLADLPARIQAMAEGLPLEVLRIRRERGNAVAQLSGDAGVTLDELDPLDVFTRRLAHETLDDDVRAALTERYKSVLAATVEGEA